MFDYIKCFTEVKVIITLKYGLVARRLVIVWRIDIMAASVDSVGLKAY